MLRTMREDGAVQYLATGPAASWLETSEIELAEIRRNAILYGPHISTQSVSQPMARCSNSLATDFRESRRRQKSL